MKQLRKVAKMWYRADHEAANAGCALIAGYPAGLLKARRVSAGAIASGKAQGGDLVVAWANEWGCPLEPGEDLRADRARAVLLTAGASYRCVLEFAPDTPEVVSPADVPDRQPTSGGVKGGRARAGTIVAPAPRLPWRIAMRQTHDDTRRYRGTWRDGDRRRIAVYVPEAGEAERLPVIVAAELDENEGSSVTNMAEYLVGGVVARHFPHMLDTPAEGASRSSGSDLTRWGAGQRSHTGCLHHSVGLHIA